MDVWGIPAPGEYWNKNEENRIKLGIKLDKNLLNSCDVLKKVIQLLKYGQSWSKV